MEDSPVGRIVQASSAKAFVGKADDSLQLIPLSESLPTVVAHKGVNISESSSGTLVLES